ncbi:hypothetical protein KUF83_29935 [Streptomyces sp. BV286]|uniref:hypothetical protein n=1 Tax=Streptomyces sp. BV286 TaxID=2849672 RepID=UPI001C2E79B5|nr:hypothetical protein [Streptomyces sp. BV286]MBV1940756.1 hypothetical protein [Streptomyces sp. BV286]
MDYAYSLKNLPMPNDPAAEDPAAPPPPELQPPQEDDGRPWAGAVYDEGDETDPAQAYAALSGPNGEQAWLDKAEDGTLTGWVRDETGQVWRYSDLDTWALDVDDAGMKETGGTHGEPAGEELDPVAGDPGAAPGQEAGPPGFGTADEAFTPGSSDDQAGDPDTEEDPDGDDTDDSEDDGDEDPFEEDPDEDPQGDEEGKPKAKKGGKSKGGKGGKPWE